MEFLEIDGSYGEGGGQILRTSLCLSIILQKPIHICHIRQGRPNPGLAAQHLTAIEAAAKISQAEVHGHQIGSQEITFIPQSAQAGHYVFSVPTAGAMTLVFQTIIYPLALADGPSSLELRGGTHVPWSPSYHYLHHAWGNTMAWLGFKVNFSLTRPGFYPQGGGCFTADFQAPVQFRPLQIVERGRLKDISAVCLVGELPVSINEREMETIGKELRQLGVADFVKSQTHDSSNPGNAIYLEARFEHCVVGFSTLGERGKPAEKVAREICDELKAFLQTPASVEEHMADQLLLPLSLADGPSHFRVDRVSQHLLTNAYIIGLFTPTKIEISGPEGSEAEVHVHPSARRPQGRGARR